MRLLVRYGERTLYEAEPEEGGEPVAVTVAEFVHGSLEEDEMPLQEGLHRRMLDELLYGIRTAGFSSERYFIQHPDPEVSALAVDLATDRDSLSRLYTESGLEGVDEGERLVEIAPRLVMDYKNALITDELNSLIRSLRTLKDAPAEELAATMQRIKELQDIRNCMERRLGDRVVLRGGGRSA